MHTRKVNSDQFKSRCRREKSAICSLLLFLEMWRKCPGGQLSIETAFAAAKRPSIEERRLSSTSPDPIIVSDQSETLSAEPSNVSTCSSTSNADTPSRGAGPSNSIDRATASADGGFNFPDFGSLYDEEQECWTTDPRTLPPGLKEKFLRDPFSPTSEFPFSCSINARRQRQFSAAMARGLPVAGLLVFVQRWFLFRMRAFWQQRTRAAIHVAHGEFHLHHIYPG